MITPGYGLVVAQAQGAAAEMANLMKDNGTEVTFGVIIFIFRQQFFFRQLFFSDILFIPDKTIIYNYYLQPLFIFQGAPRGGSHAGAIERLVGRSGRAVRASVGNGRSQR
jgi:hypothetical protein